MLQVSSPDGMHLSSFDFSKFSGVSFNHSVESLQCTSRSIYKTGRPWGSGHHFESISFCGLLGPLRRGAGVGGNLADSQFSRSTMCSSCLSGSWSPQADLRSGTQPLCGRPSRSIPLFFLFPARFKFWGGVLKQLSSFAFDLIGFQACDKDCPWFWTL